MPESSPSHAIEIAGLPRDLPLFEVAPGTRIAVLNILGDTELVETAAEALARKLGRVNYSVLVTAEAKSIPLIHALSVATGQPYVVLRKNYKPYMGDALQAETLSITTGKPQTLFLDEKDRALLDGARIVLVDDVISSGSTLQAMRAIVDRAGAHVAAEAAILTEGERENWHEIIALGHLPVFSDE